MAFPASPHDGVVGSLRSVDGAGTVHLEVHLAHDGDAVWAALTDRRQLSTWLGELQGDLRQGGTFSARFFATGWEGSGRVDACEPASRLRVLTTSDGEPDCVIEATLTSDGERTVLVVEDRGLPLDQLGAYGAGDQVLVEDLVAHLDGRDRCDARARWRELHPAYQELAAQFT